MAETQKSAEERALNYYNEAMKLKPEDNYSKEAEELLNKALKLDGNLVDAWTALGHVLTNKGQLDKALQNFQKAIELV